VGVASQSTIVKVGRTHVELKIWDTAGQEQYSSLVPMFCRGTQLSILVGDLSRPETIAHLSNWRECLFNSGCRPPIVAALNKCDLCPDADADKYEAELSIADAVVMVSAKTAFNIDHLFGTCAKMLIEKGKEGTGSSDRTELRPAQDKHAKRC
jgi:small GTP-binding protein